MAQARKILARSKAIKSIAAVTRTMEMVATARFKRAFKRNQSARKYIDGMAGLVEDVLTRGGAEFLKHPLLSTYTKSLSQSVIIITSDRGLCGGYNQSLLKLATGRIHELRQSDSIVELRVAGKKGIAQFKNAGFAMVETFSDFDGGMPSWRFVSNLVDGLIDDFLADKLAGAEIIYSRLIGAGRYEPTVLRLLPIIVDSKMTSDENIEAGKFMAQRVEYEFVPSSELLLSRLLPMTVRLRLYQCFMEAVVTEQIARMASMRAANENADEMIHSLTVKYNRTRQAQITTELAEILGGRVAME